VSGAGSGDGLGIRAGAGAPAEGARLPLTPAPGDGRLGASGTMPATAQGKAAGGDSAGGGGVSGPASVEGTERGQGASARWGPGGSETNSGETRTTGAKLLLQEKHRATTTAPAATGVAKVGEVEQPVADDGVAETGEEQSSEDTGGATETAHAEQLLNRGERQAAGEGGEQASQQSAVADDKGQGDASSGAATKAGRSPPSGPTPSTLAAEAEQVGLLVERAQLAAKATAESAGKAEEVTAKAAPRGGGG
ncbi:unnamed protein product, partial [Amoebophrya sp. A25]